jgi:hypothetical protein
MIKLTKKVNDDNNLNTEEVYLDDTSLSISKGNEQNSWEPTKQELASSVFSSSSLFKLLSSLTFLCYVLSFILFKILIQICKIISYISISFSDKTHYNKIYDIFSIFKSNK